MSFRAADFALTWAGVFLGVLDIDVVELELLFTSSFSVDKDLLSGFLVREGSGVFAAKIE